ncbi:unnamed protein product [Heligmosomoides polygyrus]|uniref:PABS domain-containing protein n=1 Tax=Heligmosomoides polygyrus TaxID=6339 RepID=A0A183GAS8_HELPZ|nr:unnamed protein product [Heligmosomoides polygyrus]
MLQYSTSYEELNITFSEEMFTSGAIQMKRDVVANVLIIGMGAGALNSYLYTTYPKMNITVVELEPEMVRIALRWFNLTMDARQRVLTMDGVEFLKSAVAQGTLPRFKYNAIHIDACVMNFTVEINCPVEQFLSYETIANVAKVLDERGVVNLNVISILLGPEKAAEKVMGAFTKHFHICYSTAPARDRTNMIVTCTNSEPPEDLNEKYERFVSGAP